jgi:hypothetical protein
MRFCKAIKKLQTRKVITKKSDIAIAPNFFH